MKAFDLVAIAARIVAWLCFVFVNPSQWTMRDFEHYPRDLTRDTALQPLQR